MRGREVYVVQPTGPQVDRHLMELLFLGDACRRAMQGNFIGESLSPR
jgi:ribose-phosphate pyrophosphokinase